VTTDVACFGELLWDFYEADARAEKEAIARTFRREIGGSSANVALTLTRLGVKASVVGSVGEDKLGVALEAALAAEGVDTSHVVKLSKPTGVTFVTLQGSDASFVPHRGADLALAASNVTAAMAKAKWLVLSSTSMMASMRGATEKLLAHAATSKAIVVVDMNVRAHLWADPEEMRSATQELVKHAVLIKAGERDLAAVAGKRGMSWLDEHAKHASWLLTRGENGAAAVGAHGQVTAPTKRVRASDRSGAGDAFLAGALAVLVRGGAKPGAAEWKDGKLWTRALEVGHVLAAKGVASVGSTTGLTSLDDIRGRLVAPKKG
jgi:fructokinase